MANRPGVGLRPRSYPKFTLRVRTSRLTLVPFDFDQYTPDSAFVRTVWQTQSDQTGSFISQAVSHWELVITKIQGHCTVTLRGPETKASFAPTPPDAEFWGIQFQHGSFMPHFPIGRLVDGGLDLPKASKTRFWLGGSAVEIPSFEDADIFIGRLIKQGELVKDSVVEAVLRDEPIEMSLRTVQRRFSKATGLSLNMLRQIERGHRAMTLLEAGLSIADVIYQTGYADQPHLTRSLKHLSGKTPAQILRTYTKSICTKG